MRNKMIQVGKQIIVLLLVCCLLSGSIPSASAKNLPHGWAGEEVAWQYNPATMTLTFSGKGWMEDLYDETSDILSKPEYAPYVNKIKTVVFKEGIISVGAACCYGMFNLTTVKFAKSIKTIDCLAFNCCYKLKKVTLPPNLKRIEYRAFCDTAITKIKLPDELNKLDFHVFDEGKIEEINIPKSLRKIPSEFYSSNKKLTSYKVPDQVELIEEYAFYGCKKLKQITLNKKLKKIDGDAFAYCKKLKQITFNKNLKKIGAGAFEKCENLTCIKLPSKLEVIESRAFSKCRRLENVVILSGNAELHSYAFSECSQLKTITIPDTVDEIEEGVFSGCTALKTIKLPKDVEKIEGNLFKGSGLRQVIIPSNVYLIGECAFQDCKDLKEIHIKSKKLEEVDQDVCKGIPSDCVIYVPKTKVEQYRGMFQRSGLDPAIQIVGE